jgi:hypothetical protein
MAACLRNATTRTSRANITPSKTASGTPPNKFEGWMTPEELWAGAREHVYTHVYHTEHCFFLMRKLSRAVDRRERCTDHKSLQVEHADHYLRIITETREGVNSTNDVVLGSYRCVPLPWAYYSWWNF